MTTAQRSAELPNVPTLSEAGVSGFEMSTWYGVFVTAGTPPDVVAKLQTELARIIKLPDVQAKLKGLGGEPGNMSPDEFSKMNKQDFEKFGKLIKQANIKMWEIQTGNSRDLNKYSLSTNLFQKFVLL